jgi:hypothetical protein
MAARGYGSGVRTHYSEQVRRPADLIVAVVALAAAAAFVVLRVTGVITDWYPFPDLSWPAVGIPGVLCCLALVTPVLVWRR